MPNIPPGSVKKTNKRSANAHELGGQSHGFALLEVLVAMTLVVTSWISLGNTYQKLVLSMGQLREKRVQIHQELDQHEISQAKAAKINSITSMPKVSLRSKSFK
ncbi:MAG: hypothetical protein WA115_08095 [Polynucleobacter sp.]